MWAEFFEDEKCLFWPGKPGYSNAGFVRGVLGPLLDAEPRTVKFPLPQVWDRARRASKEWEEWKTALGFKMAGGKWAFVYGVNPLGSTWGTSPLQDDFGVAFGELDFSEEGRLYCLDEIECKIRPHALRQDHALRISEDYAAPQETRELFASALYFLGLNAQASQALMRLEWTATEQLTHYQARRDLWGEWEYSTERKRVGAARLVGFNEIYRGRWEGP